MQQAAGLTHRIKSIFTFERIFILILILAFILRFWQLDLKLLHHDEAIHSWFCYELLTKGAWQYDPSYHGPFLYYVTTGMFALIGPSDFAARLLPSLFGFAIIPLVYCIYRIGYINKNQTLVAALFIAISPDMVYLLPLPPARYLHALFHDAPPGRDPVLVRAGHRHGLP